MNPLIQQKESNELSLSLHDDIDLWEFDIRLDGCIHITRFFNDKKTEENRDYLHVCDLEDFIKTLQEINSKAKEYFSKEWPL